MSHRPRAHRFDYFVSPPPPPPAGLSLKQQLLELDPHGFELARKKLEEVYPTLDYVATSSAGAAVGDFPPPYEVSPQQLTRAFLASRNADGELDDLDSLGKRIVQSQHTGIWRLACRSLVDFFNDPTNAGRGSLARASADASWSAPEHDSLYDRNLLLYVTTEVAVALEISDRAFSIDAVWRRMCDHGGYLVPTEKAYYESYDAASATLVPNFLPIVTYGSLELLRSTAWAVRGGVSSAALFPEDLVRHVRRDMASGDWLRNEENLRYTYAPSAMQGRYCDGDLDVTVDDALGNPQKASSFLYDIYKDERITQGRSGAQLSAGQGKTVREGGPWMYAKAEHFEAEVVTDKYRQLNLNSLVYVTSSHDLRIPPGIHRLLDLEVFADEESCRTVAYARCESDGYGQEANTATRFDASTFTWIPAGSTRIGSWFTTLAPPEDYAPTSFVNGVDLFVRSRLHTDLAEFPGSVKAYQPVFNGVEGCRTTPAYFDYMVYGGTQGSTKLSVADLINRLRHPTPPPPEPPSPPSPPPSTPPPSPPPPDAPLAYLRSELRERVFEAEKAFCTQVYWRTVDERCDELSIALTTRYHVDERPPPSLPPQSPAGLPPPVSPPLAPLDGGLADVVVAGATLSTLRQPTAHDAAATTELVYDGFYSAPNEIFSPAALAALAADERTRCVGGGAAAALPCVSAVMESNCLDGARACDRRIGGSDDAKRRNSVDAHLELRLESAPRFRRAFLHSVKVFLPNRYELASLFFQSDEAIGGRGHRIEAIQADGSVAATATDLVSGVPDSRELEALFSPLNADASVFRALANVEYVRITLPGDFRQLWLLRVEVVEKAFDLATLEIAPPSPPPRPRRPPAPPPTGKSCDFHVGEAVDDVHFVRQDFEGCELTEAQCCQAAALSYTVDDGVDQIAGFYFSDHKCCTTFIAHAIAKDERVLVPHPNFAAGASGIGFVNY